MSNESNRQGQQLPPPPWPTSTQPDSQPYSSAPATSPYHQPAPGMATLQQPVQHPQAPYRLPHPGPYQAQQPAMYVPPQPQVPPAVYPNTAPRQRTAIACRYCRRRKIRCSGFDTSQDGRCSNCVRFNQECMFTPVSSQTQAFVPAHAAYPHLRNVPPTGRLPGRPGEPLLLYGAHGQPLPHQPALRQDNTLPPPMGMYAPPQSPYGRPPPPLTGPPHLAPPMLHDPVSRKRPYPDDAVEVSPLHGHSQVSSSNTSRSSPQRAPQGHSYSEGQPLPPVSSAAPVYQSPATPTGPGPFYPPGQQDGRRLSSHSTYNYDPQNPPPPANPSGPTLPLPNIQPSSTGSDSGATPPPGQSSGARRSGLSVTDMLMPAEPQNVRTDTDNRMVNALDRRGLGR